VALPLGLPDAVHPNPVRRPARHGLPGPPDIYPGKDAVAGYLKAYAAAFNLPVRLNSRVTRLGQAAEGFEIRTQDEVLRARQVVVATGPFQVPFVPPAAQRLDSSVTQLHSAGYRNPQALPPGPVLAVGGGNSGFQIAEELATAGRQVDLSIGTKMPVLPQRPAGRDLFWWLTRLGLLRISVDSRPGQRMSSRDFIIGGSRRRLREAGVRFRPAVAGADARTVRFADGTSLDAEVVIWATGYRPDYSWLGIPGILRDGKVIHRRGVTQIPACTSWACPGSTPAARPCSASSTTMPPSSQAGSPPAPKPVTCRARTFKRGAKLTVPEGRAYGRNNARRRRLAVSGGRGIRNEGLHCWSLREARAVHGAARA
jgi:hypothetical protein